MVRYARNVIEEFRRAKHYKYNLSVGPIWAYCCTIVSHWQGAVGSWRKGEGEGGSKVLNTEGRRSPVGRQVPAVQGAVLTRLQWLGCHLGESPPGGAVCADVLVQVGTGLRTLLCSGYGLAAIAT